MSVMATQALVAATLQGEHPRPAALVIGTGLLGLFLTVLLGAAASGTLTVAHEGGHAAMVVLLGGAIDEVRVHRDGGGWTKHVGLTWTPRVFVSLAGYLGPSLFGLLFAVLVTVTAPVAVLWVSLVLLGLLLLTVRGLFGWALIVAAGVFFYVTARYGNTWIQTLFALTWTWFLLVGGVRDAIGLSRIRGELRSRGIKDTETDAAALRRQTFVPAPLWVGLFLVGTVAALVLGAAVLLHTPTPA